MPADPSTNTLSLNLTPEDYRNLGGALAEMLDDYEHEHSQRIADVEVSWKLYDAEPRMKTRTFPWRGASNLVVPYIRTAADAIIAQHISLVFDNPTKIWVGRSENEQFANDFQDNVLRFLNWAGRNEIDGFFPILDWINENVVLGQSYLIAAWRESSRYVLLPRRKGTVGRPPGPQKITLRRSVVWEHIPQEAILFEAGVPIQESSFVATQAFQTWGDLVANVEGLGWRREAVEASKGHPARGTPGAEGRDWKERREGISRDRLVSNPGDYDLRTVFVDWPVIESMGIDRDRIMLPGTEPSERVSVPLVVELCPQSQQVFRVSPSPYLAFPGWAFFDLYFRKRSGRPSSPGVARILDHIQRGMTTMVNQAIDAVTLANAMPFGTTDPKWKDKRLQPGQGVYVDRAEGIFALNISKNILPDIAIVNLLQVMGDRVSGVNDPLLGRETRMGGHPSPATNVLTQLQQTPELGSPP